MSAMTTLGRGAGGWGTRAAIYGALGLFLGVAGPFGSYFNDSAPTRIAYWVASTLIGYVIFDRLIRWTWPHAERTRSPVWIWLAGVVLLSTIPITLLTRGLAVSLWPFLTRIGWVEWYSQSLLIGVFCAALYIALGLHVARARDRRVEAGTSAPLPLPLPPKLGRALICLQMEDHYVRVHTREGSDLVLMPLGQAIARLGGIEGMRVHRSWWVARRAVEAVIEDGRSIRLKLTNGIEAPVSRANVARLRAAGWLAPTAGPARRAATGLS